MNCMFFIKYPHFPVPSWDMGTVCNYPAIRTGSSYTHLKKCFLVVTCPRPPVFARPNKIINSRRVFCYTG